MNKLLLLLLLLLLLCGDDAKCKQIGTDLSHVFVPSSRSSKDTCQDVDVMISNERIHPVDPVVIVCEDEVYSISQNSPVRNIVYGNQGTGIDSNVALYNVIVEVNPQVFEVANLEESDVIFDK